MRFLGVLLYLVHSFKIMEETHSFEMNVKMSKNLQIRLVPVCCLLFFEFRLAVSLGCGRGDDVPVTHAVQQQ